MKVAKHARAQSERSMFALLAHADMAATLMRISKAAKAKAVMDELKPAFSPFLRQRPMHWKMNADHSVTPVITENPDGSINKDKLLGWANTEFESRFQKRTDFEDGSWLSTIFLGLDHNYGFGGPPILFESMVFSATLKEVDLFGRKEMTRDTLAQDRYATFDEAMAGHARMERERREIVVHMQHLFPAKPE